MTVFNDFPSFQTIAENTKTDMYSGNIFMLTPNKDKYFQITVPGYGTQGSIGWGLLMSHHRVSEIIYLTHLFPEEVFLFDDHLKDIVIALEKPQYIKDDNLKTTQRYRFYLNSANTEKAKNTRYAKKSFEFKTQNTNFLHKDIFNFIEDTEEIYDIILAQSKKKTLNNYCYNEDTKMYYCQQEDFRFLPIITDFIDLKINKSFNYDFSHLEGCFGNCNVYGEKNITTEDLNFLYRMHEFDKQKENALIFPSYMYEKFKIIEEKKLISQTIVNTGFTHTNKSVSKL